MKSSSLPTGTHPRIALDVMGADLGVEECVRAGVLAAQACKLEVVLVGSLELIQEALRGLGAPPPGLTVCDAQGSIEPDVAPARAVKHNPEASINVATRLLKEGRADAVVSAGHSGAVVVSALFNLGRLPGVERPGLLVTLPGRPTDTVLLDVGAIVEAEASTLIQLAQLGDAFARAHMGLTQPRVALVSNGEERQRGTRALREAWQGLEASSLDFVGAVEGHGLFSGQVDVAVCDGFTGNVLLKSVEGLVEYFSGLVLEGLTSLGTQGPHGDFSALLAGIRRRLDYTWWGGALLVGVDGLVVVAHGRSNHIALRNAIELSATYVERRLLTRLRDRAESSLDAQ